MKSLLIAALLLLFALTTVPTATAGPTCIEPLPDQVEPCLTSDVCLSHLTGCFDATSPKDVARWVEDQLGPCACDPVD